MTKTPLGPPPPPPIFSDVRLKADVAPLDAAAAGLTLYRFRYRDSEAVHVGVMAQEVLEVMPEAVSTGEDGYLRVDYQRLGLRMMDYAEWRGDPEDARLSTSARLGPPPPPAPSDLRLKADAARLGSVSVADPTLSGEAPRVRRLGPPPPPAASDVRLKRDLVALGRIRIDVASPASRKRLGPPPPPPITN